MATRRHAPSPAQMIIDAGNRDIGFDMGEIIDLIDTITDTPQQAWLVFDILADMQAEQGNLLYDLLAANFPPGITEHEEAELMEQRKQIIRYILLVKTAEYILWNIFSGNTRSAIQNILRYPDAHDFLPRLTDDIFRELAALQTQGRSLVEMLQSHDYTLSDAVMNYTHEIETYIRRLRKLQQDFNTPSLRQFAALRDDEHGGSWLNYLRVFTGSNSKNGSLIIMSYFLQEMELMGTILTNWITTQQQDIFQSFLASDLPSLSKELPELFIHAHDAPALNRAIHSLETKVNAIFNQLREDAFFIDDDEPFAIQASDYRSLLHEHQQKICKILNTLRELNNQFQKRSA